jgi:hypothetical protein
MRHRILYFLLLAAIVPLVLTSCEGSAASTPELYASSRLVRTTPSGARDTILISDTLHVGDTLRWYLLADGRFNTLQSFQATCDTSVFSMAMEVDTSDSTVFAKETDLSKAKLVFMPGKVYACSVWLRFIPRKAGTQEIELSIASDAGEKYSPRSWTYTSTVK